MRNEKIIFGFIVAIFLALSFVSALSVGGISESIEAYPGQVIETRFTIQNLDSGAGSLVMQGAISDDNKIVRFVGEDKFSVPAGGVTPVPIRISVPKDAQVGQVYGTNFLFRTIESEGAGEASGASFVMNLGRKLNIIVIEKPLEEKPQSNSSSSVFWIVVLVIIIVLAIIWKLVSVNKRNSIGKTPVKSKKKK